jgi:hypothetical protein
MYWNTSIREEGTGNRLKRRDYRLSIDLYKKEMMLEEGGGDDDSEEDDM